MNNAGVDYDLLHTLIAPIAQQPFEVCIMLYIDSPGRLAGMRHVRGARDVLAVPIRSFVADAIAFDANAAIMAHNHPSGDCSASRADIALTSRLARAFGAVGVALLDHLVVAGAGSTSLRAQGYL